MTPKSPGGKVNRKGDASLYVIGHEDDGILMLDYTEGMSITHAKSYAKTMKENEGHHTYRIYRLIPIAKARKR